MKHFSIVFTFILLMTMSVVLNDALECESGLKITGYYVEYAEIKDGNETCTFGVTRCFKFICDSSDEFRAKIKACGTCNDIYSNMTAGDHEHSKAYYDELGCKCEESDAKDSVTSLTSITTTTTSIATTTTTTAKNADESAIEETADSAFGNLFSMFLLSIGVFISFILVHN